MDNPIPRPPEGVNLPQWIRDTRSGPLVAYLKTQGVHHTPATGAIAHLKHLAMNGTITMDDWLHTVSQALQYDGGTISFETRAANTGTDVQTTQPPAFPNIGTSNRPEEDITDWIMSLSVDELRQTVRERFAVLDPDTRQMVFSKYITEEDINTLVAFLRRAKRRPVTRAEYLEQEGNVRLELNLRMGIARGAIKQTGVNSYEARYIVHQIDHPPYVIAFTGPLVATITKDDDDQYEYRLHSFEGGVRQGTADVHVVKNGDINIAALSPSNDWRDAQTLVFQEFISRYEAADEQVRSVVARFAGSL